MAGERRFDVPQGSFRLERFPVPEANLLAWDAADNLVLDWVAEAGIRANARVLVVNDRFGALAIALADHDVSSWSDSYLAHRGLERNLKRNGLSGDRVHLVPSPVEPASPIDLAIIKVPKSLAQLEDQLGRLRPLLSPGAIVVGAGMTKQIHNSTLARFEDWVGPTKTSFAKRKARLIHSELDPAGKPASPRPPEVFSHDGGLSVVSRPGVFSSGKLDQGTRVLLEALATMDLGERAVDLGCGNGIVGAWILTSDADAKVHFTDESYQAIESARETLAASSISPDRATFSVDDCGSELEPESADLVVVNPPFHYGGSQSDRMGWAMLEAARTALVEGGRLVVVGNRHRGHRAKLSKLFGGSRVVLSTPKFSVLAATR